MPRHPTRWAAWSTALCPEPPRTIPHARTLNIACRTAHLAAFGLLLGGHAWGVPAERLLSALWVTIASGLGLVALDVAQSARWLIEARGLLVGLKVGLLLVIPWAWDYRVAILLAVVVVASVGSHMPARFRHASLVRAPAAGPATAQARALDRNGADDPNAHLALRLHELEKGEHPWT